MGNAWIVLMAMTLSLPAFAKDEPVTIDGKHILITDVSKTGVGNTELHASDLKNGVYIMVSNGSSIDSHFVYAERSIKEVFQSRGIKVSDSLENSSMAIRWGVMGAVDMAKADQAAAYTATPTAGQVASGGIQLAGAAMNSAGRIAGGGATGVVGFIAGALFETDSKLALQTSAFQNPVIAKVGLFGVKGLKSTTDDTIHQPSLTVFYKLEKGKEASDDVVLKMAVDQWISQYVVFDSLALTQEAAAPPASPTVTPESTISSAETIDQKK